MLISISKRMPWIFSPLDRKLLLNRLFHLFFKVWRFLCSADFKTLIKICQVVVLGCYWQQCLMILVYIVGYCITTHPDDE